MGHVFLAWDSRLNTEVVIKVPTDRRLRDPEFHQRFLQESRLLTQLSHPRIVKILDVGEEAGVPYFVMPYIAGGSLLERLRSADGTPRAMSPASLKFWLDDIAEALDFMHQQGYVHRDVKPANILFDQHGHACLSDFGLSKILSDDEGEQCGMTAANAVVGTPNYVAPELVLARRDYDGRVDQYSLAVTVYEVLTGKPPLEGGSPTATMVNQTTMHPKLLSEKNPDIPADLAAAVRLAMSKRPWRRYDSCTDFANAVLQAVDQRAGRASAASSRSSATAYSTVVKERPDLYVAARTRGQNGVVPCPACGQNIALKARYAGQRGTCLHCQALLFISKDLCELQLLKTVEMATSDGSLVAAPTVMSSRSPSVVVGTERLGVRFSSRWAMLLTLLGLVVLLLVAALIGRQSIHWAPPPAGPAESPADDVRHVDE